MNKEQQINRINREERRINEKIVKKVSYEMAFYALMIEEEKYYVALGMERYGGGFAQKLGEALARADMFNAQKIKETWPDEWKKYLHMGKHIDKREDVI